MSKKNQHVMPSGDQWGVKGEKNSKFTSLHDTQAQAIKAGREIARNQQSELVIHNKQNKIIDKDSYGNDPCPPKDKKH